jgi:signal transduction histidine kinase
VDAMPGGGKLTVSAIPVISPVKGRIEEALIEIEDTGHGIDEADMSEIFTPFFTRKQNENGTGIGLTICKRIIEAHKGKIEVHSRKGLGTKIAITVPVKTNKGGGR